MVKEKCKKSSRGRERWKDLFILHPSFLLLLSQPAARWMEHSSSSASCRWKMRIFWTSLSKESLYSIQSLAFSSTKISNPKIETVSPRWPSLIHWRCLMLLFRNNKQNLMKFPMRFRTRDWDAVKGLDSICAPLSESLPISTPSSKLDGLGNLTRSFRLVWFAHLYESTHFMIHSNVCYLIFCCSSIFQWMLWCRFLFWSREVLRFASERREDESWWNQPVGFDVR